MKIIHLTLIMICTMASINAMDVKSQVEANPTELAFSLPLPQPSLSPELPTRRSERKLRRRLNVNRPIISATLSPVLPTRQISSATDIDQKIENEKLIAAEEQRKKFYRSLVASDNNNQLVLEHLSENVFEHTFLDELLSIAIKNKSYKNALNLKRSGAFSNLPMPSKKLEKRTNIRALDTHNK